MSSRAEAAPSVRRFPFLDCASPFPPQPDHVSVLLFTILSSYNLLFPIETCNRANILALTLVTESGASNNTLAQKATWFCLGLIEWQALSHQLSTARPIWYAAGGTCVVCVHYLPYYVFHRVIKGSSRSDVLDYFFSLPPSSIASEPRWLALL